MTDKEHVTLDTMYKLQLETNDKINKLDTKIEVMKVKVALIAILFSWAAHFVADKIGF